MLLHDLGHRGRKLRAHATPVADAFMLQFNRSGAGAGIVGPHYFNRTAIAGAVLLNHNDAVVGLLAGANARQTNHDHGDTVPFKSIVGACLEFQDGLRIFSSRRKRKARLDSPASARLNT